MTSNVGHDNARHDWDHLIQKDRVHRSIYTDPAIFDLEMSRIFEKTWIYVGHESQVPAAGDYVGTVIGRQPVVMVRHSDGDIHVLFNRCAHKGAKLVGDECGHVKWFRCPYHGWIYETDGRIRTIPLEEGYKDSGFCKANPMASMQKVPRVGIYRGFVFASLAAEGPDLATWLRGVDSSIDNMVDRSPEGALEMTGGVLRYVMDANWKFHVENLNDLMHPMVAHQSSSQTARQIVRRDLVEGEKPPMAIEILGPFTSQYSFFDDMGLRVFDHGHSYSGGRVSIHSAYSDIPDYQRQMEDAYGPARTQEIFSVNRHNTVVYPNLTLKGAIQTIRVVKPLAVDRTLVESYVFRLKGAPDELLRRSVLYSTLVNSSANLVQPDDHEAYRRMQTGLLADGNEWVSMHRYQGQDTTDADGGRSAIGSSDLAFRNQYQAWKDYMKAGEVGE